MTDTTVAAEGTAMTQVAPGVLARVQAGESFNVAQLAELIAGPAQAPAEAPVAGPAAVVRFTDTLKTALRQLPAVFGRVVPTEPRALEEAELEKLTEEKLTIDALSTELGTRDAAICEAIRHHMDKIAERDKLITGSTVRVADGKAKGHWLLAAAQKPFSVAVRGFKGEWQQRYVKGTVKVHGDRLAKLRDEGVITQREFNACTRPTRSYSDALLNAFIAKHPERGLEILAALTTREAPSYSLYPPKN